MAGTNGQQTDPLTARLAASASTFDFYQALRRLQCAHPDKPPIGHSVRPVDDPVRFGQRPALSFAPSSLDAYIPEDQGGHARLYQHFFGLLGPQGPMPLHFTEYVRDRLLNHADSTLSAFLDMFHHRMITFFFRAWAENQRVVQHERGDRDRFSDYVGSLFGIGMDSFLGRDEVADTVKLHYAGRLACPTRNAEGLRAILADYFGHAVEIEQCVGQWVDIPDDCRLRLGVSPDTGELGRTTIVGSRVWDCMQSFRIRMGPMDFESFRALLPDGSRFGELRDWVRNYAGDALAWEAQLVLQAEEVPQICLGTSGRLGWTTWVCSKPFDHDSDDMILMN
jgi:type VI secretion system protein ImpH